MENVYDLATYKKKKKKKMLTKKFQQHKILIAFLFVLTLASIIGWLVSVTAAVILVAVTILVPFVISDQGKKKLKPKMSTDSIRNKSTMNASLFKK